MGFESGRGGGGLVTGARAIRPTQVFTPPVVGKTRHEPGLLPFLS